MAEAARQPGAMTAVVAGAAEVEAATRGLGVVLANDNAPDQTVLSGPTEAIAAAEDALREAGLRFTRLPVATAFHSPVVSAAVEPFARHLAGCAFSAPTIPVYRNETAAPYGDDVAAALAGQLAAPVRWVELIRRAYADGMRCFVEVGPGSVLTGLVGRILEGSPHQAFSFDQKGRDSTRSLWLGLGRLAAAGRPLHLAALTAEYGAPVDPATRVGPRLAVSITGGNVGNPYPPPGGAAALPPPNPPRRTPPAEPPAPALPAKPPTPPTPPSTAMSLTPPAPPLAPAAAPAPASSSSSSSSSLAWIAALQESQRQTALAHTAFQTAMMEAHTAFLRASEVGFASMASMAGGAPLPSAAPLVMVAAPVMQPAAPLVMTAEPAAKATAPVKPAATPVEQPTAPVKPAATPVEQPTAPIKPAAAPIKPAAAGPDLGQALLAVVAEKTGYPAEMLRLDMELEGDLGIDSIKRVEILSALQERLPSLPELDAAELGGLHTLAAILGHLGQASPAAATPATAAAAPAAGAALEGLLLAVVAEKTGYPAEMLRLDMELEGDLGIDSIKRVEILSALQERAPGLPDIDGADLAALSTLGHITAHLNGLLRQPAPPATAKVSPPSAEPDAPPTVFRTTLSLHEAPPSGLIRAGLLGGRVYLSDDGQGLRGPLALALKDAGVQIVEEAVEADAAVFLGGLRPDPDAASVMGEALALARTLARRKATGLVTVQDTGGGFGLLPIPAGRATLAGLAGLARTAAIEWDGAAVKVIDLCLSELRAGRASPADLARRLADELVFGGPEREVGLPADGRRLTLADRPTPAPGPEALPLADGDVVLITGGARGVTAACALALAAQGSYRFALLGRSPLVHEPTAAWGVSDEAGLKRALASSAASPAALGRTVSAILAAREVRRTLDLLVTMGSEARYLAEDVTDYTALAAALQGLRQHWGPIAAVVHGAGVIADKRLEDKTQAQLDLVWSTKVTGAENLLAATAGDPLKVLCFFTSVAARVGNEGQADYAMANEALNKLARAEQARRPGCRVTALGWGPWEGGMVSPALRRHFAARGLPMLPLALGGEAFVAALGDPSVELVLGGEGFGGAAPRAAQDYDIQVDVDRLPFLLDHAIDGLPVIPVALVLEWFARAAGAFRPDLHLAALRDVRVVRGIPPPPRGHPHREPRRLYPGLQAAQRGLGAPVQRHRRDDPVPAGHGAAAGPRARARALGGA
jgi:malonyl CoA-acyl carrier protein transacylase